MSKLSFRARALDPSKQMPIYLAEELPDLQEYSAINRAVPQMPSGMEKEEESEHHLQRAICTGLIIPTPEVFTTDQDFYDKSYPPDYKMPRQMIHMQPLGLEQDVPEYDMDSSDELWLNQQGKHLELTPLKFEQMMDRLEKSSGQMVVKLNEAKALLKQDDEVSVAVYDYWLNKRLKTQHPLILSVKTENRPGASSNNPYLAFRRRTEKMQTRKNRKNDEASYEKMLKLRRDLQRATTLLEMVKRREKTKREQLHLSISIFEKRVQLRDFNGAIFTELSASLKSSRPAFTPLYANQYAHHSSGAATPSGSLPPGAGPCVGGVAGAAALGGGNHMYTTSATSYLNSSNLAHDAGGGNTRKEKRPYKKRKHKRDSQQQLYQQQQQQYLAGVGAAPGAVSAAGVAAGAVGAAAGTAASSLPAHLHHLHQHRLNRQSSSPAANESTMETDDDDGGHAGARIGSESEEDAPFAFIRRQASCNYLKPLPEVGNWPWESKDELGLGDPKYRFTLTSIRHPRPRCIGFARRRMGRGGRVILDRLATNLDDFWSHLDYTILESGCADGDEEAVQQRAGRRKKSPGKPVSPPTVVDLPSGPPASASAATANNNNNPPANSLDSAPAPCAAASGKPVASRSPATADSDSESCGSATDEEVAAAAALGRSRANIARDDSYTSGLTLLRKWQRLRAKRKLAHEPKAAKKPKLNHQHREGAPHNNNNNDDPSTAPPMKSEAEAASKRPAFASEALKRMANSFDLERWLEIEQMLRGERARHVSPAKSSVAPEDESQASLVVNNHNYHKNRINNNNNSNRNINKNVSAAATPTDGPLADLLNVIKQEPAEEESPTPPNCAADGAAPQIKREDPLEEAAGTSSSASDSNEPLSSIQKAAAAVAAEAVAEIDDEDNVNLAQLSSLIKHHVKKEEEARSPRHAAALKEEARRSLRFECGAAAPGGEAEDDEDESWNQMPDVIRVHHQRKQGARRGFVKSPDAEEPEPEDEFKATGEKGRGSLSPSTSQRLDICHDLLSEIRRDWLHFRPKTPTDEWADELGVGKLPSLLDEVGGAPVVGWSQQTPIALGMLRVLDAAGPGDVWGGKAAATDPLYVSDAFKYSDLDADTQLMQTPAAAAAADVSGHSPQDAANSSGGGGGLDFNFSGDSLADINLLGDGEGDEEPDADMLDNILQECQIDDLKTLHQATNFWNGILDGEPGDDVEAAGLLDCIDDGAGNKSGSAARAKDAGRGAKAGRPRPGSKQRPGLAQPVGSSTFSWAASRASLADAQFFRGEQEPEEEEEAAKKDSPPTPQDEPEKVATETPKEPVAAAAAPFDAAAASEACATASVVAVVPQRPVASAATAPAASAGPPVGIAPVTPVAAAPPPPMLQPTNTLYVSQHVAATSQMPPQVAVSQLPSGHVTSHTAQFNTLASRSGGVQLMVPQTQLTDLNAAGTAVGDIITITNAPAAPPTHVQQTSTVGQQQQQQKQQILQIQQTQLRHMQHTTHQQQSAAQQQHPLHQQHLLLQMQRDISSNNGTPIITTQYIPTAAATPTGSAKLRQQQPQQPTLTPIGSTASGNHMIYASSGDGSSGPQKIYIQKTPATSATSSAQVPSLGGTNAVITLANVKLDGDGGGGATSSGTTSGGASILAIDNTASGAATGVTASPATVVVSSGVSASPTVNIINSMAGGQPVAVHSQMVGGSTPLIVTTPGRGSQLGQHQLVHGHPTQQFVWRQIGGTSADAAGAGGNKFVWASRPGQKRQLNGPEDINKLLLGRKFPRKIFSQQQQQHPIQIIRHVPQAQTTQQQEEDGGGGQNASGSAAVSMLQGVGAGVNQQQQQKVQMQGGKVIKMPYPLLVSELNMQQQQQQQGGQPAQPQHSQLQQKHNSAAIAANHNYSLQPTATIIATSQGQHAGGGNKIYLTTSSAGSSLSAAGVPANFTIATAPGGELSGGGGSPAGSASTATTTTTTQKIHYKDLQASQLKVNFVATSSSGGTTLQHGNLVVQDGKTVLQQHHVAGGQQPQPQQQTVVLNKAQAASYQQQQQQKMKRDRIVNIIGTGSMAEASAAANAQLAGGSSAATPDNAKRIVYTLKNNQMQMLGSPGITHAVLSGRLAKNQAIFTNYRTLPITMATAGGGQVQQLAVTTNSSAASGGGVSSSVGGTLHAAVGQTSVTAVGGGVQQQQQIVETSSLGSDVSSTSSAASAAAASSSAATSLHGGNDVVLKTVPASLVVDPSVVENNNSNSNSGSLVSTTVPSPLNQLQGATAAGGGGGVSSTSCSPIPVVANNGTNTSNGSSQSNISSSSSNNNSMQVTATGSATAAATTINR